MRIKTVSDEFWFEPETDKESTLFVDGRFTWNVSLKALPPHSTEYKHSEDYWGLSIGDYGSVKCAIDGTTVMGT